jgi:hypothetical protein
VAVIGGTSPPWFAAEETPSPEFPPLSGAEAEDAGGTSEQFGKLGSATHSSTGAAASELLTTAAEDVGFVTAGVVGVDESSPQPAIKAVMQAAQTMGNARTTNFFMFIKDSSKLLFDVNLIIYAKTGYLRIIFLVHHAQNP